MVSVYCYVLYSSHDKCIYPTCTHIAQCLLHLRNHTSSPPDMYCLAAPTAATATYIRHVFQADQLVVQGMMASRYLAQFEEVVGGWQTQLSMVRYELFCS